MNSYQANWAFCILPILIIVVIVEIRRGWRVLHYKELSLNLNQRIMVWVIHLLRGDKSANHYHEQMMNNPGNMILFAWYSFAGGIIALIICLIWAIVIIRLTT